MDNDAESYRRYLEGDERAFDEIVDSLFHRLVFFVNGYLHDYAAAEDVAIETFTDLFVNKKQYDFRVSLKTYVFMIGKSKALNALKRRKLLAEADFSETDGLTGDGGEPEADVLSDERSRIVRNALSRLPGDMQTALHLLYFENMDHQEAAKVMGKTKKQMYNLVFRAKAALRDVLGDEGKDLL